MQDRARRTVGAVCLAGVALAHLSDLPDKVQEAPYMAVLFCALIIGSAVLAAALLAGRHTNAAWAAAGAMAVLTIAGYLVSRSVGLPQLEDHVGEWVRVAGIASLMFEAAVVLLGVSALVEIEHSGQEAQPT
jgi:hypothetical protein